MNIDLATGLYISNPLFSLIIILLWAYLVMRYFEFSLSLMVVGSFIIQYSEVQLLVWKGSLLVPFALTLLLLKLKQFINIPIHLHFVEKKIVTIVTIFFIFQIITTILNGGSAINISISILLNFVRSYLPFYGVFLLLRKNNSLFLHIKFNAYVSLLICIGYIFTMFSSVDTILNIISLRMITFWNMPIGSFSFLAMWSLFYFASKLILVPRERRKYIYFLSVLPVFIVFISQSRGLLPSILFGFVGILLVSKMKVKSLLSALTGVAIILLIMNNLSFSGLNETMTNIYLSRFDESAGNINLLNDSRFSMNKEALASILEHPLGGASIESKVGIHNHYLNILMRLGIFGLLYMMLLYLYLQSSIKYIFKMIPKVTSSQLMIITGLLISNLLHTLIAGLLGGVDTLFYWSIAMILVVRKEIASHIKQTNLGLL